MILPFWLRPSHSSQIVDRIFVTIRTHLTDNNGFVNDKDQSELKLEFIGCGTDLRNANEFITELTLLEK